MLKSDGEFVERMGEFEVYQFEGRKVLFLGGAVYSSVMDEAYDDWVQGWLSRMADFYGKNLGTGSGESSCSESATRKE